MEKLNLSSAFQKCQKFSDVIAGRLKAASENSVEFSGM